MASLAEDVVRIAVAVVSLLVFLLGAVAYRRRPSTRMLLVLLLFTVFLVQGIVLIVEVFVVDSAATEATYYAFQLVEVVFVAAIILARSPRAS